MLRGLKTFPCLGNPAERTEAGSTQLIDDPQSVTSILSYDQPYAFVCRMSTLDHLTGGRVGWNVVTGHLDSAARASGRT